MKASMSVNIALNSWLLLQKIYLGVMAMKYCRNNFAARNCKMIIKYEKSKKDCFCCNDVSDNFV